MKCVLIPEIHFKPYICYSDCMREGARERGGGKMYVDVKV